MMYCTHCGKEIDERKLENQRLSQNLGSEADIDVSTPVSYVCPRCSHLIHHHVSEQEVKTLAAASHAEMQKGRNRFASGMSLTVIGIISLILAIAFFLLCRKPRSLLASRVDEPAGQRIHYNQNSVAKGEIDLGLTNAKTSVLNFTYDLEDGEENPQFTFSVVTEKGTAPIADVELSDASTNTITLTARNEGKGHLKVEVRSQDGKTVYYTDTFLSLSVDYTLSEYVVVPSSAEFIVSMAFFVATAGLLSTGIVYVIWGETSKKKYAKLLHEIQRGTFVQ